MGPKEERQRHDAGPLLVSMLLAEVEAASRGNSSGQIIDTRNQYYSCSGSLGVQCLCSQRVEEREKKRRASVQASVKT